MHASDFHIPTMRAMGTVDLGALSTQLVAWLGTPDTSPRSSLTDGCSKGLLTQLENGPTSVELPDLEDMSSILREKYENAALIAERLEAEISEATQNIEAGLSAVEDPSSSEEDAAAFMEIRMLWQGSMHIRTMTSMLKTELEWWEIPLVADHLKFPVKVAVSPEPRSKRIGDSLAVDDAEESRGGLDDLTSSSESSSDSDGSELSDDDDGSDESSSDASSSSSSSDDSSEGDDDDEEDEEKA